MPKPSTETEPQTFDVFHRTWWKANPSWPNGREPQAGERHYIAHGVTRAEALELCAGWNENNDEGTMSDRAEFERD